MKLNSKRFAPLALGMGWALLSGMPAMADDTELFLGNLDALEDIRPNILFIIDNSLSMNDEVESQSSYDPAVTYADAGCGSGRYYYKSPSWWNSDPPSCSSNNYVNEDAFVCRRARNAFANGQYFYEDRYLQHRNSRWYELSSSHHSSYVECRNDAGYHGRDDGSTSRYIRNSSSGWGNSSNVSWPGSSNLQMYSGNYLNWYYGPTGPQEKIQVVKDVTTNLLNTISDVNIGLMYFNNDQGGTVAYAIEDISTARSSIIQAVNDLETIGFTPLTETLYEAAQYWRGGPVIYGNVGPVYSTPAARTGGSSSSNTYASPLELGCQKNFIVYLSDGEPTQDTGANSSVRSLTGEYCGNGDGDCLPTLARFLNEEDQSNLDGMQNVTTYMIGFDIDHPLLAETAAAGGGAYFTANNAAQLSTALSRIVSEIQDSSTTFTAPTVSVNSFNQMQNLNDLYISVFRATRNTHWPGNLKKFTLHPTTGEILDAQGRAAVDQSTGFFASYARDGWSATDDGPNVEAGGAANLLPSPATRKVYTYLGTSALTAAANQVVDTNPLLDDDRLGLDENAPDRADVIAFMRGLNVTANQPRNQMGDPLHAQPVAMMYGADTTRIYFATNDGYLHSIDAETGVEQWAFIPPEFLEDQVNLYLNPEVAEKQYGIDGNLTIQTVSNNDGVIEGDEKVYLYFGMRRGGQVYYALDITNPDAPSVMWSRSFPDGGQSWSEAIPAKVRVGGASQNSENLVLVIGGGYATAHDSHNLTGTDSTGNSIYIVDSLSGSVLWHASNEENPSDQSFAQMNYAIPAGVKVVDMNGDGLADRMYASDMGGQVWRFDIANGNSASSLVTGGVLAQLGGAPAQIPALDATRRFYYPPDVALVNGDPSFVHIGIGSGHRARPNSVFTQDRFYALRDYNTFRQMSQAYYDSLTPITDADLEDITSELDPTVPANSPGWKMRLGGNGEKVLAEARTFNNQVYFTSFTPGAGAGGNADCQPALGSNRLYIVDLLTGAPVNNLDGVGDEDDLTLTDRYIELQGSISSEVVFIFPSPEDPSECVGEECAPPPVACVDLFCFPTGFANAPVRTLWTQDNVD